MCDRGDHPPLGMWMTSRGQCPRGGVLVKNPVSAPGPPPPSLSKILDPPLSSISLLFNFFSNHPPFSFPPSLCLSVCPAYLILPIPVCAHVRVPPLFPPLFPPLSPSSTNVFVFATQSFLCVFSSACLVRSLP